MVHKIEFNEHMKYEKCTVTKRNDGRYFCRIAISYETDENGKKTYHYKSVYNDTGFTAKAYVHQSKSRAKEVLNNFKL